MPRVKQNRVCGRDGCGKPHKAKGLCDAHYTVFRAKARRQEREKSSNTINPDDFWLFVKKEVGIK